VGEGVDGRKVCTGGANGERRGSVADAGARGAVGAGFYRHRRSVRG
jgi:hypothetical protein